MQHHDHAVTLPLRLAAEPYAKDGISSSCVSLGIAMTAAAASASTAVRVELGALADDDGIRAFCISELLSRADLLQRLQSAVPSSDISTTGWKTQALLVLVRANSHQNPNLMQWHWFDENAQDARPIATDDVKNRIQQQLLHRPVHNAFVAELITNSIRTYYRQQILEPSVRGFLSVLEKQFARSDLYLFELLQNAVDDGATVVEFSLQNQALHMTHNGRRFTPLDVLGLSSVGLSTKSRQGKRTIGFMGVGFKAVYKRYARVSIDDGTYRFVYQEPPNNKLGYGWVMLPLWQTKQQPPPSEDRTGWCRFALEQPRGGAANIQRDLLVLPRTAPPLLGRAALVKSPRQQKWILNWNGKRHTIERSCITSYSSDHSNGSELITVTIANDKSKTTTKTNHWLFVTHRYKPSQEASDTYQNHTKRSHEGLEEVCGFVPLVGKTHDIPHTLPVGTATSPPSGWVHSVLPTKIRMPVPIHFQGSWLLSVDRQQVQDLTDNAWNGEILKQFPQLIATLFRWAAAQQLGSSAHYQAICQLLPNISTSTTATTTTTSTSRKPTTAQRQTQQRHGGAVANILGQEVSLKALERAFWSEPILPVGMAAKIESQPSTNSDAMDVDTNDDPSSAPNSTSTVPVVSTGYYEGAKSIWVPPSWFEFLDADFLRGWLGKRPLRTDLMGEASFHPLFASELVLCQLNPLPMRTNQLAAELGVRTGVQLQQGAVWKTMRLMAAIGSSYNVYPDSTSLSPISESGPSKKQNNPNNNNGNSQEGAPVNISMPSLPSSMADWPVFITESCGLARLDQVVLPGSDFAELPIELLGLLRPYFIKDSLDVIHQHQQKNKFGAGKRDKKNKRPPRPLPLKRVHNLLESAMCMVDRYSTDSNTVPKDFVTHQAAWTKIATSTSSFLKRAREQFPANVVDVATAATNLLESYSAQRELSEEDISAVLKISNFAFETSNHLLLKYVLVDVSSSVLLSSGQASSPTRLVQASGSYIGKSLDDTGPGADLENFAGSKLQYVSSRYNSILETASVDARRKAIHMFALAGVQTGISISVSVAVNVDKDKRLLERILTKLPDGKLPSLRKNATKSDVILPYGLGVAMNKKKFYLLDSQLPMEWERLATAMSPTSAIGFISLLLSIPFDNAINVTPSSVVAAAKCLAGRTELEEKAAPVETAKLSKDTSAPLRRRLYFLPPGQAGAKALDISEARLVEQLESIRWLPCSVPSLQQVSLTLLRPREALLEVDSSRPEMPVVELPPPILKRLKTSQIAKVLTWGTQAPPPPVGELAELAREAKRLLGLDSERVNKEAVAAVASRMFDVWNAVCRSHVRDGLLPGDLKALRVISSLPCIPVRRVLDSGESGNWIVQPNRCVRMSPSLPPAMSENETLKHLTVTSLVASDFICDFSHSTHNPFFHQPEVSSAVVQLAGIRSLVDFPTSALVSVCGSFVRYCCTAEPVISSRGSSLRESFSFCLNWCLDRPTELPKNGQGLKLYVRHGPGIGTKALPARWVPLKGGPIQAVLNDNKTRCALLSPEMKLQALGVLDHSENEKDCANAKLLSTIDTKVIKAFGVLRLSDKRFIVKTRARGTPSIVGGASSKLQLVCSLLKAMELDRLSSANINWTTENNFLDRAYEPPAMIRHDSLTREFQAPGMEAPTSIPLYAMFGRAPKLTKKRCILVSGEPADYSMELEELILDHVGVRTTLSLTQMKPYRAACRLLSHLENNTSFNKFVKRDFVDFEATVAWQSLMERKEIVVKLQDAEKALDRQQLRELLIRGEELFDEDHDGGDSVLQSARDLLSRLEEEEAKLTKERQEKEEEEAKIKMDLDSLKEDDDTNTLTGNLGKPEGLGRGRGVDNRPAWMTTPGTDDKLSKSSTDHATKGSSIPNDGEAEKFAGFVTEHSRVVTNGFALDTNSADVGRGRGKGRTLPAWMTSTEGPTKTSEASTSSETNGSETATDSNPIVRPVGAVPLDEAGRGRGVGRTLPAWMTSGAMDTAAQHPPLPEQPIAAAGSEVLPTTEQAKSILSSILNDAAGRTIPPIPGSPPPLPIANTLATGRGRGVSNLPAWMTNTSSQDRLSNGSDGDKGVEKALKRCRPSSPSNLEDSAQEDTETQTKRARLIQEDVPPKLRLTLNVDLVPSQELEFLKWFKRSVNEEVIRRGGSVVNLSVNGLPPGS